MSIKVTIEIPPSLMHFLIKSAVESCPVPVISLSAYAPHLLIAFINAPSWAIIKWDRAIVNGNG